MSNYIDMYRARIYRTGDTEQQRVSNRLSQDFKHLLRTSPDYIRATLKGVGYDCVLQSGNSRAGQQSERKVIQYLLTELDAPFVEGSVFTTYQPLVGDTRTWICLHEEAHAYYGYSKYKVIELNWTLKYYDEAGNLKTVPAYINGTGEFDIKEYFHYSLGTISEVPYRALNLIWAANPDIKRDLRIMIGEDEVWRVIDSDKISIPGVYYTTVYKTTRDTLLDDVPEKIAADIDPKTRTISIPLDTDGSTVVGKMEVGTEGKVVWTINSDLNYQAATNSNLITLHQEGKEITITAKDMFGMAVVQFYLNGTLAATADLEIKSIWVT